MDVDDWVCVGGRFCKDTSLTIQSVNNIQPGPLTRAAGREMRKWVDLVGINVCFMRGLDVSIRRRS